MTRDVRAYDPDRDRDDVVRIWREIGWIDDSETQAEATATLCDAGSTRVGTIDGTAECAVLHAPGSIRYQRTDLPLRAITGVTTSRIARRQGFASRLTAMALADGAAEGDAVAALGMFDQGFYDRLGFGTGPYEHRVTFDPATLEVDVPARPPVRLTGEDHLDMHAAMLRRCRGHGSIVLHPPEIVKAEYGFERSFALGVREDDGRLSGLVMGEVKQAEFGPLDVTWLAYETPGQLFDLLGLLRSLGDQIVEVTIASEPAEVQLQDLVDKPLRQGRFPAGSGRRDLHQAQAWWQLRVLDVAACVSARHWPGPEVRFALSLTDPLADRDDIAWEGVAGDYVLTLGAESSAEPGTSRELPVLEASVGAFSRMLFGVRPASSLALTDQLSGPPGLLADLNESLRLPPPRPGWFF